MDTRKTALAALTLVMAVTSATTASAWNSTRCAFAHGWIDDYSYEKHCGNQKPIINLPASKGNNVQEEN